MTENNKIEESKKNYKVINEFFIAGVQHHKMHKVIDDLAVGQVLQLIIETNKAVLKYDINAVKIVSNTSIGQTILGFVPMKISSSISALLEIDEKLECVITTFNKLAKPWERCKVSINMLEE